jgi:hypothetical protein
MPWYRCLILGENFPGELIGKSRPVGFYVNRFVEAPDPKQAEQVALAELRREKKLALPEGVKLPGTPVIRFEEITQVLLPEGPPKPQGFAWFLQDD